jgi:hypothetical protein
VKSKNNIGVEHDKQTIYKGKAYRTGLYPLYFACLTKFQRCPQE